MFFDRIANGIQRHYKAIIVFWIVAVCVSAPFALKSGEVMHYDMTEMFPDDTESAYGAAVIKEYFPAYSIDASWMPILVTVYDGPEEMMESMAFIDALTLTAAEDDRVTLVQSLDPTSETGRGIIITAIKPSVDKSGYINFTPDLRDFVHSVADSVGYTKETYLTGLPPIDYDMSDISVKDIEKIDPFAVLMILVLIGLFFRSFISSAVPPMAIGLAFTVTMAILFLVGQFVSFFYLTNMLILVTMLGVGCDYCIFIVARYREGLRKGSSHDEAVHEATKWAGESICISGMSAAIGFGCMSVSSFSMVATLGFSEALGVIIALIASLTLIPSILQMVGDKIFWPTSRQSYEEGGEATKGWYAWFARRGENYFDRSARISIKHAKAIAVTAILVSVPSLYVVAETEDSYDLITSMLAGESKDGMQYIGEYADKGLILPIYTVMEYKEPIADVTSTSNGLGVLYWTDYWRDRVQDTLADLSERILEDPNISYMDMPFQWDVMLELIDEAGIIDTDAKVQFVLETLSPKSAMIFKKLIEGIESLTVPGVTIGPEILFDGFGPMIDEILTEKTGRGFDWDREVSIVKSMGVTDPETICNIIISQMDQDQRMVMYMFVSVLKSSGIPEDALVNGTGVMLDYIMNINNSAIGGEFSETGSGIATYVRLSSTTKDDAMSPRSMESIEDISAATNEYKEIHASIVVDKWETGSCVQMYEVSTIVKSQFSIIEALVAVMIALLLLAVMRSYLIPIRSVLTILMSIFWTNAIVHVLFVDILGQEVLWLIPILILVICLGLGMDYDILLTTRIRENRLSKGMSNDEAIRHAVTHTGSIITLCGLIMGGGLGMLMLSSMVFLQQLGFALFFAILVDALVVRTYIVPAIMHLLGDYSWKGPGVKKESP